MRRGMKIVAAAGLAAASLAVAVPAFATTAPQLTYDPPTLVFQDLENDASAEDVEVSRAGKDFRFLNPIAPFSNQSECQAFSGGMDCRRRGIEKIVVNLGDLGDEVQINLGSVARDVKQVLRGEDGGDILRGEKGSQTIRGGEGVDTLQGGAGPDFLDGGPGPDNCLGGPGNDTIIHCGP